MSERLIQLEEKVIHFTVRIYIYIYIYTVYTVYVVMRMHFQVFFFT